MSETRIAPTAGSEALLAAVLDALDEAVIIVRWPDRRIVRVNRACERIFGLEAASLVGQSTEGLHVDREHFERFGKKLAEGFASGSPASFAFEMRRADGEIFPTEHHVDLLRDASGAVLAGVAITRDVSARQRAETDLASARDALHRGEKLAALGSLVAGVAHEIRTPLAYISNHAHLVERRGRETPDGAPLVENARAIMDGVERINSLVAGLRRFTRMQADERTERDLSTVVQEASDMFAATHGGFQGLDLDLRSTPRVPMDRLQIQQVVLNLLQNAVDTAGNGAGVHVATGPATDGGAWLEVRDEGPGMQEQVRRRIFEPFFTTKPEGMGLGLAIVRRIVDAHGGTIECESVIGKGTTFRVRLPPAA